MAGSVASSLHALCERLIDYAGTFPPASLTFDQACANYGEYRTGEHSWMLGRFVAEGNRSDDLPDDWPVASLSDHDISGVSAIECKCILSASKAVYCEVPQARLPEVKRAGSFAKLRCAGASTDQIAEFVRACRDLSLPFKLTAGLHAPLRSIDGHGFVNVFASAAFVYHGVDEIRELLDERDPMAFAFGACLEWRGQRLSTEQVRTARRHFAHSLGSCSFEEPIAGLQALGWL